MKLLVAVVVSGALVGCATESDGVGQSVQAVQSSNRLAANRLAANRLAANRLAANGLALAESGVDTLAEDEGGRELLSYLISCALPAGASITATTSTGVYSFAGSIGLAPEWASRAPTLIERRWVSACLLARTNAFGVSIKLSMRGDHPMLAATNLEKAQYSIFEGGFYGDLWADPQEMLTCATPIEASTLADLSTLAYRQCSVDLGDGTTICGFTYTGDCLRVCPLASCPQEIQVYLEREAP